MPPRPRPRSWLARRLRAVADAVDGRMVGGAPPPPADPVADRPRRPGEPPEHWLRLVAAHAPGLLHDLDLPAEAADPGGLRLAGAADPGHYHGWTARDGSPAVPRPGARTGGRFFPFRRGTRRAVGGTGVGRFGADDVNDSRGGGGAVGPSRKGSPGHGVPDRAGDGITGWPADGANQWPADGSDRWPAMGATGEPAAHAGDWPARGPAGAPTGDAAGWPATGATWAPTGDAAGWAATGHTGTSTGHAAGGPANGATGASAGHAADWAAGGSEEARLDEAGRPVAGGPAPGRPTSGAAGIPPGQPFAGAVGAPGDRTPGRSTAGATDRRYDGTVGSAGDTTDGPAGTVTERRTVGGAEVRGAGWPGADVPGARAGRAAGPSTTHPPGAPIAGADEWSTAGATRRPPTEGPTTGAAGWPTTGTTRQPTATGWPASDTTRPPRAGAAGRPPAGAPATPLTGAARQPTATATGAGTDHTAATAAHPPPGVGDRKVGRPATGATDGQRNHAAGWSAAGGHPDLAAEWSAAGGHPDLADGRSTPGGHPALDSGRSTNLPGWGGPTGGGPAGRRVVGDGAGGRPGGIDGASAAARTGDTATSPTIGPPWFAAGRMPGTATAGRLSGLVAGAPGVPRTGADLRDRPDPGATPPVDPWPALPVEPGGAGGVPPAVGTTRPAAGRWAADPWPALPDDPVWRHPAGAGGDDHRHRLDAEQRGV